MQDIHSVDGGGIFGDGGGGGSGERRVRPHHHHHHPTNQALKCPRCDSSNTKFCYYNNYNLSQPRHFCKGCRRYWTKGGVLRNVPVGGGCRKTKRSRPKSSQSSESVAIPVVQPKSSSNSSSESSSLTATTTTTTAAVATEAVSASSSRSPTGFLNIQEFMNPSQGFDHEILEESTNCGFFSGIGNFTSLINSSNDQLSFRFDNLLDPQNQWQQPAEVAGSAAVVELKAQPAADAPPFVDDDVKVKFSPAPESQPSCTSIFGPSDWQPSSDQGLFDLPNAVDHSYNWSQPNPWTDGDQPSYIP